jgi:hypothetical protein
MPSTDFRRARIKVIKTTSSLLAQEHPGICGSSACPHMTSGVFVEKPFQFRKSTRSPSIRECTVHCSDILRLCP